MMFLSAPLVTKKLFPLRKNTLLFLSFFILSFLLYGGKQTHAAVLFQPRIDVKTAGQGSAITAADFDHDGNADFAVGRYAPSTAGVINGLSSGNAFLETAVGKTRASAAEVSELASGDFNKDGNIDLAVLYRFESEVVIVAGTPTGLSTTEQVVPLPSTDDVVSLISADIDGDTNLDLVLAGKDSEGIRILFGDGRGGFPARTFVGTGERALKVATGDINNDGRLDLVTADWFEDKVTVNLGQPGRKFENPTVLKDLPTPVDIALADMNGDGNTDLVSASYTKDKIQVMAGKGDATFSASQDFALRGYPEALAVGDLDGDGTLDVAAVLPGVGFDEVDVFSGTTQTKLLPTVDTFLTEAEPEDLAIADFDGDGHNDLSVASRATRTVSLFRNSDTKKAEVFASLRAKTADFSELDVDTASAARSIKISNSGSAPLQLKALRLEGANPDDFKVTQETCTKQVVAIGKQCFVDVVFYPHAAGLRTAKLQVTAKQPVVTPMLELQLSGTGRIKEVPQQQQGSAVESTNVAPVPEKGPQPKPFFAELKRKKYQGRTNKPVQIGFNLHENTNIKLVITKKQGKKRVVVKRLQRSLSYFGDSLTVRLAKAGTYQLTVDAQSATDPKQSVHLSGVLVVKKSGGKKKRQ